MLDDNLMKYRSRTEITTMILNAARSGSTKTKIMYGAYLSYGQLLDYLEFLMANDLITCEEGSQIYRVTEKGIKLLNISYEMNELMTPNDSKYCKFVLNQ
jgi:predicted transcriptional regulator